MKKLNSLVVIVLILFVSTGAWAADDHKENDTHQLEEKIEQGLGEKHNSGNEGEDKHAEGGVALNPQQLEMGQIIVTEIQFDNIPEEIKAPGEVVINAYRSTKVTPRIAAQVISRYALLGQGVEQGQVLATLSSVDMAEAQGKLLVFDREWQRVKKLGSKVVSERRYIETQVAYEQAYAKVIAYGMTKRQVNYLLKEQDVSKATGEFELLATQDGTVIKDDFIVGEIIEPGRILYVITDENKLWVEARLTPEDGKNFDIGAVARILSSETWLMGKVVHVRHTLDESTRTFATVIEVPNLDDQLHPGMFVDTRIESKRRGSAITIPEKATIRSADGDWVVFVELEVGHYKPMEVEIVRSIDDRVVVKGINPGTRIVTQGVFFLQSELAKSGFDIHNH